MWFELENVDLATSRLTPALAIAPSMRFLTGKTPLRQWLSSSLTCPLPKTQGTHNEQHSGRRTCPHRPERCCRTRQHPRGLLPSEPAGVRVRGCQDRSRSADRGECHDPPGARRRRRCDRGGWRRRHSPGRSECHRHGRASPMRIAFVTQWFPPEQGTFVAAAIADGLAERGHEVHVLTGFPNYPTGRLQVGYPLRPYRREIRSDRVVVHRAPLFPSHDASAGKRAANYLSFA